MLTRHSSGFCLFAAPLVLTGALVTAAGCSSAPSEEATGRAQSDIVAPIGSSGVTSCPAGYVLECIERTPTACIGPECVKAGSPAPPPACGVTGGACCPGNGSPGSVPTCNASYDVCANGTCVLCGGQGDPACADGCPSGGIPTGSECLTCGSEVVKMTAEIGTNTAVLGFTLSESVTVPLTVTIVDAATQASIFVSDVPANTTSWTITPNILTPGTTYNVTTTWPSVTTCGGPSLSLTTEVCGASGQIPCAAGCNANLTPDSTGHCVACGQPGELACGGDSCDGTYYTPDATGHCVACGQIGQLACGAVFCTPADTAPSSNGTCQYTCGLNGQPCCSDIGCRDSLVCYVGGVCGEDKGFSSSGNPCTSGGAPGTYSDCITCPGGEPFTQQYPACTQADAQGLGEQDYDDCTVNNGACPNK